MSINEHLNSVRTMGLNSSGKAQSKNGSMINNSTGQSASGSMQPGMMALNSQRVPGTSKKVIDSKMSNLRHEQDSTAASNVATTSGNNQRFPMSPDDAFKILSPYLWEVERREIFEYQTIYFFPVEERKKQKLNPSN